jgi:hypothetical protein
MKTRSLFYALFFFGFLLSGCTKPEVDETLKDDSMRQEVYSKIMADHGMMTEFMNDMHSNDHAMKMMCSDPKMMMGMMEYENMQNMMHSNDSILNTMMSNMMQIAEGDSVICRHMMGDMMKRPGMHKMMMDVMGDHSGANEQPHGHMH